MLAIPAAIVLVLLVVILVMDRKPAGDKAQGSTQLVILILYVMQYRQGEFCSEC